MESQLIKDLISKKRQDIFTLYKEARKKGFSRLEAQYAYCIRELDDLIVIIARKESSLRRKNNDQETKNESY